MASHFQSLAMYLHYLRYKLTKSSHPTAIYIQCSSGVEQGRGRGWKNITFDIVEVSLTTFAALLSISTSDGLEQQRMKKKERNKTNIFFKSHFLKIWRKRHHSYDNIICIVRILQLKSTFANKRFNAINDSKVKRCMKQMFLKTSNQQKLEKKTEEKEEDGKKKNIIICWCWRSQTEWKPIHRLLFAVAVTAVISHSRHSKR